MVESNGDDYIVEIIPTSDDKFIIFWLEDAWPAASLKFTKIDMNGDIEIGWNPNGNQLSTSQMIQETYVKMSDEDIGMLAIWTQDGNFSDIYAQVIIELAIYNFQQAELLFQMLIMIKYFF